MKVRASIKKRTPDSKIVRRKGRTVQIRAGRGQITKTTITNASNKYLANKKSASALFLLCLIKEA